MATTHHPAPTHVGFGQHHEWMWITLGAVVVALIAAAVTWAVMQRDTDTATLPANVTGFQYEQEATTGHAVTGYVKPVFVGESGDLHAVIAPILGFETMHEATPIHMPPSDPVTVNYMGNSGVMYPEVGILGFELDHETTPVHLWDGVGVIPVFVGES